MTKAAFKIGLFAGTGLDNPHVIQNRGEINVETPFGKPSSPVVTGTIGGVDVCLIFRHGKSHEYQPSHVKYRANILAFKQLGCTHIVAASAVGSLKEEMAPGDFVFVDQFIDRTHRRDQTFYDHSNEEFKGVCHIPMGEPFCPKLRELLQKTATDMGIKFHPKGTAVTIEGPRFSSKAESNMFRQWGCDVVGMTTVPEVILAREAGLCYTTVCMVTDYDCWKEEEVNVPAVMKTMKDNAMKIQELFTAVIPKIAHTQCECMSAIKHSVM
eukprot:TRINITY_DN1672_c0_g1_i1.p1 TRINITY_DN1672_c0_g1~~TRINITY_DN1672_c0_g1_i1.p1  ORF type:complete len:282 (-),score=86.64 TRINITY_DN1672_c0_g1_i1:32-838(-)